ncbi:poly glycohydrolase-domain-containing protein [Astrocystis sublimbata]|nr:poly glycohydrolase-domain-containing protein [Astrocystis sublimbata]
MTTAETTSYQYLLPSAASFRCIDRFSILENSEELEDSDGQVPFWPVFTTLLKSSVRTSAELVEFLETVAVTLRASSGPAGDYQLLESYINTSQPLFFDQYWPVIVRLALKLPQLFPNGSLQVLCANDSPFLLELSREQTACLVVHQFLCTLRAPIWREDFFDFSIWYASEQRHELACQIYLTCLFSYLDTFKVASELALEGHGISYTLVTADPGFEAFGSSPVHLCPIEIVIVDNYQTCPEQLGLPSGATVVAANRYVGFGQSATQEEVQVGSSPEACPAVLFTPPLEDNQVLIIRGAKAVMNIRGQRRDIEVLSQRDVVDWHQRTMLFMDALEIDLEGDELGLPDLSAKNMARELNKAAIAFSSGAYHVIHSPLWGCGAFGADPFVKVVLLWCAASVAKTSLKIICDRESQEVASKLKILTTEARKIFETAQQLIEVLESIPRKTVRLATFDCMMQQFSLSSQDCWRCTINDTRY